MSLRYRSGGPLRRGYLPGVEGLEARNLLSPGPIGQPHIKARVDPNVIKQVVQQLYTDPAHQPTPVEVRNQSFISKWVGTYIVGPGRFSSQANTVYMVSKNGGSNQFLKGRFQNLFLIPKDNTQPVTGVAALFPSNFVQSSDIVLLDWGVSQDNETPPPYSDSRPLQGLPTHLPWTFDTTSAGNYTAPLNFTQGAGVADFKYIPDPHPLKYTEGSGHVIITFQGLINNDGILNVVSKIYN